MLRLVPLAGLALFAQPKKLEGMKQQFEAMSVSCAEVDMMNGAAVEDSRFTAVHTGDVMFVPSQRRKEGFPAGQMPAANLSALLQLAQVSVNRCQSHRTVAGPQTGVQVLSRQLLIGILQVLNDQLLPLVSPGSLGGHALPLRRCS